MHILVIYQYCTFGGVERVVLNRAEAFRKHGLDVRISMGYLQDAGALPAFRRYISNHGLNDRVNPFLMERHSDLRNKYDLILIIDTPQILNELEDLGNVFLECHTPYKENRQYLGKIPLKIKAVLVPSESFKSLLQEEFPRLPPIHVLPNCVPGEFFEIPNDPNDKRIFARRPLTYLGRLDRLKNIDELLRIYGSLKEIDEIMYLLIGSGAGGKEFVMGLKERGLLAKALLRNKIEFGEVPSLVRLVRNQQGLYLSASKNESFGLSPAEFMSGGVPAILSDIPAHRELVNDDKRFLYRLGDIESAQEKVFDAMRNWDELSNGARIYATKFTEDLFLAAWLSFLAEQGFK